MSKTVKNQSLVFSIKEITDEIQTSLWSQPPSSTDKNIAGNLSLVIVTGYPQVFHISELFSQIDGLPGKFEEIQVLKNLMSSGVQAL